MEVLPSRYTIEEQVPKTLHSRPLHWKDLPIKKRKYPSQDDPFYQKMQPMYMTEAVESWRREKGFATKAAIMRCPCMICEAKKKQRKISNKMKCRPMMSNEVTEQLLNEYFKTGHYKEKKTTRKIPKRIECGPLVSNEVTERLKEFITSDEMYGSELKLVIQKTLHTSDLKSDQNRLNLPFKQLVTQEFLTDEEKRELGDNKAIEVRLVGPTLQMYEEPMTFKIRSMSCTKNYVLITNWNHFVADNIKDLKEFSKIQLWSFRKDQQLCFALAVVETPDVVLNKAK
ncbi:B3 domain-containing protein, DNA-binding pseudobarrel domain protein [Tanacetum coccineum]